MMAIDLAKFFIERAADKSRGIVAEKMPCIDSIRALANGDKSGGAKRIEKPLAKTIPILIGFLATLLGVTGPTGKVQKACPEQRQRIIKRIRKLPLGTLKLRKEFQDDGYYQEL